ncbi:MAG: tetratricopeptide repeat protein [Archaeoglobaceae archaeon]
MNVEEFVRIANSGKAKAEELCIIGEKLLNNLKDHEKGRILGTLGNLYFSLGNFEKAEMFYLEALKLYVELAQKDGNFLRFVCGCLFNLGNLYHVTRKYEEAKKSYLDALSVTEFLSDTNLKSEILSALGVLEIKMGEAKEAEKHLSEALKNLEGEKRVKVLNNLAVALIKLGEKEEAEKMLKEALNLKSDYAILQNLLLLGAIKIEELEALELPIEIKAKVKYLKAKKLETEGKNSAKEFFEAGCLAFIAFRTGFETLNYMHCFDKAIEAGGELGKDAEDLKRIILKFYYGAAVEIDEGSRIWKKIKNREFNNSALDSLLKIIAEDLERFL